MAIALAAWALPAAGQGMGAPPRVCSTPIAPDGDLSPWIAPAALLASADSAAAPTLEPGRAADVTLLPMARMTYPSPPAKSGQSSDLGGIVALRVAITGTYRIALGAAAWIDVVRDGQAVAAIAHRRGPDCTGIRKQVDFGLQPGVYTLQLSASQAVTIRILAVRLP